MPRPVLSRPKKPIALTFKKSPKTLVSPKILVWCPMFITGLAIGLFIGALIGVLVMAVFQINRGEDD
jgi:hypothetical protein